MFAWKTMRKMGGGGVTIIWNLVNYVLSMELCQDRVQWRACDYGCLKFWSCYHRIKFQKQSKTATCMTVSHLQAVNLKEVICFYNKLDLRFKRRCSGFIHRVIWRQEIPPTQHGVRYPRRSTYKFYKKCMSVVRPTFYLHEQNESKTSVLHPLG